MAEIVLGRRALADIDRLYDFLVEQNPEWAEEAVQAITEALGILRSHPFVGRLIPDSAQRELVISKGRSGHLALYRYDEVSDEVVVMAIHHQREAGYS